MPQRKYGFNSTQMGLTLPLAVVAAGAAVPLIAGYCNNQFFGDGLSARIGPTAPSAVRQIKTAYRLTVAAPGNALIQLKLAVIQDGTVYNYSTPNLTALPAGDYELEVDQTSQDSITFAAYAVTAGVRSTVATIAAAAFQNMPLQDWAASVITTVADLSITAARAIAIVEE